MYWRAWESMRKHGRACESMGEHARNGESMRLIDSLIFIYLSQLFSCIGENGRAWESMRELARAWDF